MTRSRLCSIDATKRKIEHMPNMTVMGNASTWKKYRIHTSANSLYSSEHLFPPLQPEKKKVDNRSIATATKHRNINIIYHIAINRKPFSSKEQNPRTKLTHIVQNNADKDIKRYAEEVHDCAPCFFRDVLGPHFHNWWPENPHTSLKSTETKKLDTMSKRDTSTFFFAWRYQVLLRHVPRIIRQG